MAEYSAPGTLSTPGGDISHNAVSGDSLLNDPDSCTGLDMAPVRAPIEDAPQTDGGLVQPFLLGARLVVLSGIVGITSAGDEAGYLVAIDALEAAVMAALNSITSTDGTYSWTPRDGDLRTITVRCNLGVAFAGPVMNKRFTYGLVAADPTIVVT